MSTAIRIENVSKLYRLRVVGTGTISHDLNRWWHRVRGKEDSYVLPTELRSHFLPNYRCREFGGQKGGFAELFGILEEVDTAVSI